MHAIARVYPVETRHHTLEYFFNTLGHRDLWKIGHFHGRGTCRRSVAIAKLARTIGTPTTQGVIEQPCAGEVAEVFTQCNFDHTRETLH